MGQAIPVCMGELKVVRGRHVTLACRALGSCVAVALFDREAKVAGIVHVMLPRALRNGGNEVPGKYADQAVGKLLDEMKKTGANGRVVAKIAGGAQMFNGDNPVISTLGQRNVEMVRAALLRERVTIVATDTGGKHARSVFFDALSGRLTVRSMELGTKVL